MGPFSSLPNSAPPSIRKQRRMTPPLTSSSRSGNQNKPGGRGGGYLAGKHSQDSPNTGGAGIREFTPCSLDSPQNSFNLGWGARDWNNRQENNA